MKNPLLKASPAKEHLRLHGESWFAQHRHTFLSFPPPHSNTFLLCLTALSVEEYQSLV